MNKTFLTMAAVSVLALAACEEQASETTTTDIMSSVEETTTETMENVQAATEETMQDVEAAYDEAVAEMQEEQANEINPAAGTDETTTETDETTY